MLVLSRQHDESIMIGDNIEITIVDIRGDKVRLGIKAPNTVPVHRKEVYLAIQRERTDVARHNADAHILNSGTPDGAPTTKPDNPPETVTPAPAN